MQPTRTERILSILTALALVLILAHAWPNINEPARAAEGDSNFTNLVASGDVTVGDDLSVADDFTLTDDMTADVVTAADLVATDDITATDDLYVQSQLIFDEEATITVESDGDPAAFTPTGTYQPITSAGNTGTSAITVLEEGTRLTLVNVGSNTITFTDTGTLKLSGNAALGQFDTLALLSDGTNWIQIAPEGDN
jgi:hypothetical protein